MAAEKWKRRAELIQNLLTEDESLRNDLGIISVGAITLGKFGTGDRWAVEVQRDKCVTRVTPVISDDALPWREVATSGDIWGVFVDSKGSKPSCKGAIEFYHCSIMTEAEQ